MRIIDREACIDKLSEGNIVNEAGYSGDPGGITTHSSLISGKAFWNLMLTDLINAPPIHPPLSVSLSVFLLWWMQSESINPFPCWIPDKIYKDKLNKLLMGWPISLCGSLCWSVSTVLVCVCVSLSKCKFRFATACVSSWLCSLLWVVPVLAVHLMLSPPRCEVKRNPRIHPHLRGSSPACSCRTPSRRSTKRQSGENTDVCMPVGADCKMMVHLKMV